MKKFKLENEPKIKSGFTVPDHYFDDFSERFTAQLTEEKTLIIPLYQKRKKIYFAIAAILVIGLTLPIYNQLIANSSELDASTLENHLTYQSNINQYELISELDDEDLNQLESTIHLNDENIEDALLTNSDLERLITE